MGNRNVVKPFRSLSRYFRFDIYARMFPYIRPLKGLALLTVGISIVRTMTRSLATPTRTVRWRSPVSRHNRRMAYS